MLKIIISFVITIISVICIISSIKMYKNSKTVVEKALYILLLFVYFVPIIIYVLDKNNIPTRLGYTTKIDVERWFNFIITYVSTIVGTVVSGFILVLITIKQINVQIDNNKNDKRIENSPILNYSLIENGNSNVKYSHNIFSKENGNVYIVRFVVENIGLNHCRNLMFKIAVDNEEDKEFSLNEKQSFLKKGDYVEINLNFHFDANKKKNRNICIAVYYEDMLHNKYEQTIKTRFSFSDQGEYRKRMKVGDLKIENEVLLKEFKM